MNKSEYFKKVFAEHIKLLDIIGFRDEDCVDIISKKFNVERKNYYFDILELERNNKIMIKLDLYDSINDKINGYYKIFKIGDDLNTIKKELKNIIMIKFNFFLRKNKIKNLLNYEK